MTKDQFALAFLKWSDENFYQHGNKLYYPKTSSKYFDVTKHIGKEKATEYYPAEQLLQMFKDEKP